MQLPPSGQFIQAIREHPWKLDDFGIQINDEAIRNLLISPAFTDTFERLSKDMTVTLPLNFPTFSAELNVISILSLLNFASGYRLPLRKATGRGAWDNIRYLVIAMYIDSSSSSDLLSAKGMRAIDEQKISSLLNVSIHEETLHDSIPGVIVGKLGGPLFELVNLIKRVLNETGAVLEEHGYPDLGSFVARAFDEGAKTPDKACDVIIERLVTVLPGMRDMGHVHGQNIYIFKKALFLTLAVTNRFEKHPSCPIPLPDVSSLPAMSDNVIPSMLVYLGIIKLENCTFDNLKTAFTEFDIALLLERAPENGSKLNADDLKEGPVLESQEAYLLRAAAVEACERVATLAKGVEVREPFVWIRSIRPSQMDVWLWSVAKDRTDYRILPRFAERNTIFF